MQRELNGLESTGLTAAFHTDQLLEAREQRLERELDELHKKIEALEAQIEEARAARPVEVGRLIGDLNTGDAPAIPADLKQLRLAGSNTRIIVEWDTPAELAALAELPRLEPVIVTSNEPEPVAAEA